MTDEIFDTTKLRKLDTALLAELAQNNSRPQSTMFQNQTVATLAHPTYTPDQVATIEALLRKNGTFTIPIVNSHTVSIDGRVVPVSIVNATETRGSYHGEMSYMIYLRDQIQVASAYMQLFLHDPDANSDKGVYARKLLISALHLMSTPAQLARFDRVITMGDKAGQEDWPHISLFTNDLLAEKPNGWRNKQDTFQMLAYATLEAIEQNFLQTSDLLASHKQFLAKIVPLLMAIHFPYYESSGSWEEIAARRTSVTAIETALLVKMRSLIETLPFLYNHSDAAAIDNLIHDGLFTIGKHLPNESPDYDQTSIQFRQADAALAYVLLYDIVPLLVRYQVPITTRQRLMSEQQIETLILDQLETLNDPLTGGIARYHEDSYQRVNFHTNEVQHIIRSIKQQVTNEAKITNTPIDINKKQQLRHELTPNGRLAAWTHPLGQIASWAALKSIQASNQDETQRYINISTQYVNRLLRLVTGKESFNTALTDEGVYAIATVPAFRLPEAYITYELENGTQIVVASPHTPLHWSNAMAEISIHLLYLALSSNGTHNSTKIS